MKEEDIRSIQFFWEAKEDVTRWSGWDDALPEIEKEHPELIKALNDYLATCRIMDLVVRSLEES